MLAFIKEYWAIFTTISAVLVSVLTYLYTQTTATKNAIRALLRAEIIRIYTKHHDEDGWCPVYVKESLEDVYKQYHALKGNGVGTQMYNSVMNLPTAPPDEKGE